MHLRRATRARRYSARYLSAAGAAGLATVAALLSPTAAPAAPLNAPQPDAVASEVVAPVPVLTWEDCPWSDVLQCDTVRVPRDYDDPAGPTTRLALVMRPASRPAQRIGTLFVNPGGPGGASTDFVGAAAAYLGADVRQRFDIVGIDPRGVGGSNPLVCRSDDPEPRWPRVAFPYTPTQEKRFLSVDRYLRKACATGANAIIDHMTTADTARDMDLIRQATGESQLTYYGISYGTYLGATYATMFPDRVRAMIVDGVLDPVAWSTGRGSQALTQPFSTRLKSHLGAYDALTTAFDACDRVGKPRCAFANDANDKWRRMVRKLQKGPVKLDFGAFYYQDLVSGALGGLYWRGSYQDLMRSLQDVYRQMFGAHKASAGVDVTQAFEDLARPRGPKLPGGPYGYAFQYSDPFHGVACADTDNPTDPKAWIPAGKNADRRGHWFGRLWTWASSTCARWPGSGADAFKGPWVDPQPATPLVITGNAHDPATPHSGAEALHDLMPGSRLVTLNGWGHGAIGESECVSNIWTAYLVDQTLPADGRVCRPDKALFPRR